MPGPLRGKPGTERVLIDPKLPAFSRRAPAPVRTEVDEDERGWALCSKSSKTRLVGLAARRLQLGRRHWRLQRPLKQDYDYCVAALGAVRTNSPRRASRTSCPPPPPDGPTPAGIPRVALCSLWSNAPVWLPPIRPPGQLRKGACRWQCTQSAAPPPPPPRCAPAVASGGSNQTQQQSNQPNKLAASS